MNKRLFRAAIIYFACVWIAAQSLALAQVPSQSASSGGVILSEYMGPTFLTTRTKAATTIVDGNQYTVVLSDSGVAPSRLNYVLYKDGSFHGSGVAVSDSMVNWQSYNIGFCNCTDPFVRADLRYIWDYSLLHTDDGRLALAVDFEFEGPPNPLYVRALSLFKFSPPTLANGQIFTEFAKVADATIKCISQDGCDHSYPDLFDDENNWQPADFSVVASGVNSFTILASASAISHDPFSTTPGIYSFPVSLDSYQEIWPETTPFLPFYDPLPPSFPNNTSPSIESVARDLSPNSFIVTYRLPADGPTPSSIYRLHIPSGTIERLPNSNTQTSYSMDGDNPWTLLQDLTNVEGARLVRSDQLTGTTISFIPSCLTYENRLRPAAVAVGWPSTPYYIVASGSSSVAAGDPFSLPHEKGQARLYTPGDLPTTNPRTVFKHDTLAPFRSPGGILDGVSSLVLDGIGPMTYNPATDEFTTLCYLKDDFTSYRYTLIGVLSQADLSHVASPFDNLQTPQFLTYAPPLVSTVVSTRSQTDTLNFASLVSLGENPGSGAVRDIWLAVPFATPAQQESIRLNVTAADDECIPAFLSHYRFAMLPGGAIQPQSVSATMTFVQDTGPTGFVFTMSRNGANTYGLVRLASNSPNDLVVRIENLGPVPTLNGDANADGVRDVADVTMIYNLINGIIPPPLTGDGDVDNNGLIQALDAELLIDYFLNGIPLPP